MAGPVCRCHAAPDGGLWTCSLCQQLCDQLPLGSRRRRLRLTPQTPRRECKKQRSHSLSGGGVAASLASTFSLSDWICFWLWWSTQTSVPIPELIPLICFISSVIPCLNCWSVFKIHYEPFGNSSFPPDNFKYLSPNEPDLQCLWRQNKVKCIVTVITRWDCALMAEPSVLTGPHWRLLPTKMFLEP